MKKVTDEQILAMLKDGKSYSDIQAELRVGPSRIIVVKKMYLKPTSSTNDALLGTTITSTPPPPHTPIQKVEKVEKVVEKAVEVETPTPAPSLTHTPSPTPTHTHAHKPVWGEAFKKTTVDTVHKKTTTPAPPPPLLQVDSMREQIEKHFKNLHPTIHPTTIPVACCECDKEFKSGMKSFGIKLKGKDVLFCSENHMEKWVKNCLHLYPELKKYI